jgi:hypothetical protein
MSQPRPPNFKKFAYYPTLRNYLRTHPGRIFCALLMAVGLILSLFSLHFGGFLVGLAIGICFSPELHLFAYKLRDLYIEKGRFKTCMLAALLLYFLAILPLFIFSLAIGTSASLLIKQVNI